MTKYKLVVKKINGKKIFIKNKVIKKYILNIKVS